MTQTTEDAETKLDSGTGGGLMKRHIVEKLGGWVADVALCGALWDRLNPQKGEICDACLEICKTVRPGWPLPGGAP